MTMDFTSSSDEMIETIAIALSTRHFIPERRWNDEALEEWRIEHRRDARTAIAAMAPFVEPVPVPERITDLAIVARGGRWIAFIADRPIGTTVGADPSGEGATIAEAVRNAVTAAEEDGG